jgi:hypothetical protein
MSVKYQDGEIMCQQILTNQILGNIQYPEYSYIAEWMIQQISSLFIHLNPEFKLKISCRGTQVIFLDAPPYPPFIGGFPHGCA